MFGAAQIASPGGYPSWVVPTLICTNGTAPGCDLTEKTTGPVDVSVDAGATNQKVDVKFTAGGASGLPANLLLQAPRLA